MRTLLICLFLPTTLIAETFECLFTTECYEADACTKANFKVDVAIDEEQIVTGFGNLTVVAVKQHPRLKTLFATGDGAEYMMSVTPHAARLTTHSNDGPMVISYLGTCEGAF